MASLGHVAVGVAAARIYAGAPVDNRRLAERMFVFSVVSLLPDADVVGFAFGIPYGAPFGHRGASHALVTALLCGVLAAAAAWFDMKARGAAVRTGVFTAIVMATHGPLDALTDGGRGVALLWPFTTERFFFPWRPLPVAPIGAALISREGFHVLGFELLVFFPLLLYAFVPRRRRS